jgi:Mor family transcriptional regulator
MENKGVRNIEIEAARGRGETFAEIAKRYGITPGRVRQIVINRARVKRRIQERIDAPLRHLTRP